MTIAAATDHKQPSGGNDSAMTEDAPSYAEVMANPAGSTTASHVTHPKAAQVIPFDTATTDRAPPPNQGSSSSQSYSIPASDAVSPSQPPQKQPEAAAPSHTAIAIPASELLTRAGEEGFLPAREEDEVLPTTTATTVTVIVCPRSMEDEDRLAKRRALLRFLQAFLWATLIFWVMSAISGEFILAGMEDPGQDDPGWRGRGGRPWVETLPPVFLMRVWMARM